MSRQSGGDFWASIQAERILRQQDEEDAKRNRFRQEQSADLRQRESEKNGNG